VNTVRVLTADDWSDYRETRLVALRTDPDAFGSAFERESEFTEAEWRARVTPQGGAVFAVDGDDGIVATGAVITDWQDASVRVLVAMWTEPSDRGRGHGRMIVEHAIALARASGAAAIRCSVTEGNDGAARLYESCGFIPTGARDERESDGLCHAHFELRF
jgi:ribosomal protein S18 acetylase RimI-like enzyme